MGNKGRAIARRRIGHCVALVGIVGLVMTGAVLAGTTASAAAPPTIAVGDVTVPEGNVGTTPARLAVRLSNPVATHTVVRYVTAGGTASAGTDYRSRSGKVRIRAGKTSVQITIPVLGDTATESAETVRVSLTGAGGIALSDGNGTVTIRDDESIAGLAIGDVQVWEGDARTGLAKLAVVVGAPPAADIAVGYTILAGTAKAPSDYRVRTGRVTIRAGRTAATITPTLVGDTDLEADETFIVVLTGTGTSGIAISDAVGTVTIRNDEPAPAAPTTTTTTTTAPATPGAPTDLTAVPGPFSRYLTADWTAPPSTSPITGYDLEVTRNTTVNVVGGVTAPYAFGCGLAEVTDSCTLRVRARNASGDGPWSGPVTASTWSPPAAPPNLTVLPGGGAVTWEAPASDRPIDHYEVQKRPNGSTGWTHVTTTTSTQAATTCGSCSVRVSAYSEVGLGAFSTVAIALPGSPTGLTATRDSGNTELVHLVWSPPIDPGSHPITSYEVIVSGFPLAPTAGTTVDVFLRSTVEYQIQVYANNLVGRSVFPATTTVSPA